MRKTTQPLIVLFAALATLSGAQAEVGRNGGLDPRFGAGGKAALAFPGDLFLRASSFVELALLPSGQMIVVGTVINSAGNDDFGAIRLNADGSLDTSYGVDGGRRVGFDRPGSTLSDDVIGVVIQPDGKAILSGTAAGDPDTDSRDMALVRLTASGQLDNTFGNGGRVLVPFNLGGVGDRSDFGTRIALQGDGKILLVGEADGNDGNRDMAVVRLNSNGQRDTSFDGDGRVSLDFGPDYDSASGVQVGQLADGDILLVGVAQTAVGPVLTSDFALVRLQANGAPDTGFGVGGKSVFDFDVGGDSLDIAFDFVELADGKLMVCGVAEVNAPTNVDMACMRFLADGSPDPAFAAVLVPFDRGGNLQELAYRIAPDEQGRFVLGGAASVAAANNDFALARLLPDGELDASFGNGGTVTHNSCIPFCFPAERDNFATTLVMQGDGKLLMAGRLANSNGDYRFLVARVLSDVLFSDDFED
jgi:uncharacterized delta-60 repeat protein